jgi:hypothetical protein
MKDQDADLKLLQKALQNVAESGKVSDQIASTLQQVLNEIVKLRGERDRS